VTGARPLRADAQRNRARVLAAAERVFAERVPAASTEEVARAAGVGVGTVFRYAAEDRPLTVILDGQRRGAT
jgi:AcrR family transcriptional regulator